MTTTFTEAHATLRTWQQKLAEAQQALAEHSSRLGELAIEGSELVATQRLAELNLELVIAEEAVRAAEKTVNELAVVASNDELLAVFKPATVARYNAIKSQLAEHRRLVAEASGQVEAVRATYEHSLAVARSQAEMAMRAESNLIDLDLEKRSTADKLRKEFANGG